MTFNIKNEVNLCLSSTTKEKDYSDLIEMDDFLVEIFKFLDCQTIKKLMLVNRKVSNISRKIKFPIKRENGEVLLKCLKKTLKEPFESTLPTYENKGKDNEIAYDWNDVARRFYFSILSTKGSITIEKKLGPGSNPYIELVEKLSWGEKASSLREAFLKITTLILRGSEFRQWKTVGYDLNLHIGTNINTTISKDLLNLTLSNFQLICEKANQETGKKMQFSQNI